MKSIRRQLSIGLLASLFALIALCGAGLYAVLKRSLTAEYDAGLLSKARALATLTERESDGTVEFDFADEFLPEFERAKEPEYFEIWLEDGRVLERSRSLESRDLPRNAGTFDGPLFWNLSLLDGRRGRAVGIVFAPQGDAESNTDEPGGVGPRAAGGPRVTLVLARSREDLARTLHLLSAAMGGVGLLLPVGIALAVVALVGRGLRPLDSMAAQAASIDSSNLQHRFPEGRMPHELQPICRRLNDLLHRLEEAFARERRFTGDAAHELRTPIAELRSLTEVASMDPEDADLCRQTVREGLAIARQMEHLVAVLLTLARSESGAEHVVPERVDLGALLPQVWAPFEKRASDRNLSVSWDTISPQSVETDRALLRAVLNNLFSNAVAHSPTGGTITIRTESHNNTVRLVVRNANSSLTRDDLPHLFEPFWQKDDSRTDPTQSGLGLSVVASFCRLMNADVGARLTDDNQLAVELVFHPPASA